MKIIIVGCDKTGSTIVELLTKDGDHDISVIDIIKSKITRAVERFDVSGFVGNGASYDTLRKAGAQNADLLIACTDNDEVNILCCILAKQLGIEKTAILNNQEEYYEQILYLKERGDIDFFINPDRESATVVEDMLKFPSALEIQYFANNRLELIDVILPEDSKLVGATIADKFGKLYPNVKICAIDRGNTVLIPNGNVVLEAGDRITIGSNDSGIMHFLKDTNMYVNKVKSVMILGGGPAAFYLAKNAINVGIDVTIIESDIERCKFLSEELPKATIIYGSDNDYELMRNEGLTEVDAFVAFTHDNEKNIIASLYASNKGVPKIITSVDEMNLFSVFKEIELGSVVSPNIVAGTAFLQYVKGLQNAVEMGSKLNAVYGIANSAAFVYEFQINETYKGDGTTLKDLKLKDNTIIAMIARGKEIIIPRGNDFITGGDKVIVVTMYPGINGMNEVLE